MQFDESSRLAPFFDELGRACGRIRRMDGHATQVEAEVGEYVIQGRTYALSSAVGPLPFWCGVNVDRLFFIACCACGAQQAEQAFRFCFGGARKVGWELNYEELEGGVSVWATRRVDKPLATLDAGLSEEGLFWAVDIAMMAQSWLRCCERMGIGRVPGVDPAPL